MTDSSVCQLILTILPRLTQLQEVLLRVRADLNDSPSLDHIGNFLPSLAVKLETLDEGQMLLSRPTP